MVSEPKSETAKNLKLKNTERLFPGAKSALMQKSVCQVEDIWQGVKFSSGLRFLSRVLDAGLRSAAAQVDYSILTTNKDLPDMAIMMS